MIAFQNKLLKLFAWFLRTAKEILVQKMFVAIFPQSIFALWEVFSCGPTVFNRVLWRLGKFFQLPLVELFSLRHLEHGVSGRADSLRTFVWVFHQMAFLVFLTFCPPFLNQRLKPIAARNFCTAAFPLNVRYLTSHL